MAKIGRDELDDAGEALRLALAEAFGAAVAKSEDLGFLVGSGEPAGMVNATNIARIPSAQKVAVATSNTPTTARLVTILWLLPDQHRERAAWILHPASATKIAALTHTNGDAVWPDPGPNGGGLLGSPTYVTDALPDPATAVTTQASVVFADVGSAYRVDDRQEMTMQPLEQRFAEQGQVGALLRHRVGRDMVRPAAVALYTQVMGKGLVIGRTRCGWSAAFCPTIPNRRNPAAGRHCRCQPRDEPAVRRVDRRPVWDRRAARSPGRRTDLVMAEQTTVVPELLVEAVVDRPLRAAVRSCSPYSGRTSSGAATRLCCSTRSQTAAWRPSSDVAGFLPFNDAE